ncbi:response regulator transcription factor [Peptoniphilus raoultii]|uniref:response regulator transcription factor n=1 Tax=Peptoniphilus raoultii TaxID=1776387 RepID=UPI0008DB20B2|nr:response regulator transcription factor [Peptoniphilus raoultii]
MDKILIVEDDLDINNLLKIILEKNSYSVKQAFTGADGLTRLEENFDLVLLDLMMPVLSGEEMIKKMRSDSHNEPVIVITAKIDEETKNKVFEMGADDFITKPFKEQDLLNRVKANIRRYKTFNDSYKDEDQKILSHKSLKMLLNENRILIKGEELKATPIEYQILKTLLENPNKIFSKENLYKSAWQEDYFYEADTINVHISNLRNKIKKIDDEEYIETVWAVGYRLKK